MPLRKYRNRWWLWQAAEGIMYAVSGALLVALVTKVLGQYTWWWAILGGVMSLVGWFALRRPHQVSLQHVADYLNRQVPDLQDSAELVLQTPKGTLQQWQQARVAQVLNQRAMQIPVPHQLQRASALFSIVLVLSLLSAWWPSRPVSSGAEVNHVLADEVENPQVEPALPPEIRTAEIGLRAPAYMNLAPTIQPTMTIEAWEGTQAQWRVAFNEPVARAVLVWGNGDTLALSPENDQYVASAVLHRTSFYSLVWLGQDTWQRSDYYPVTIRPDTPPEVTIADREPYVRLDYQSGMEVAVKLKYQDDFDITHSHLIATVARGSGESVKFRETEVPIQHPWARVQRQEELTVVLALDSLDMEPGDELYFFVEAFDNRQPEPQRGRTEMYFVALLDTADNTIQMEGGLGVDLMPEYFRSQRQIIIDTERLIADRKANRIATDDFKSLSNELGFDQKALRLKYGALLGLEDEEATAVPAEAARAANVEAYLQHEENEEFRDDSHEHTGGHDHEEEEGSVFSRLMADDYGEDHDHEHGEESPIDAYMHAHDDSEEATFYAEGLKAKLRLALDQMWDAELHLRLFEPAKSLPYQYLALKLIDEIRLDARIYVERVGFEPPPLKVPEVRLTGDQDAIRQVTRQRELKEEAQYVAFREAIQVLEQIRQVPRALTETERSQLALAGQSLAEAALERPGELMVGLSLLKNLEQTSLQGVEQARAAALVEATLLRLLPPPQPQITRQSLPGTELSRRWKQAEKGGSQ